MAGTCAACPLSAPAMQKLLDACPRLKLDAAHPTLAKLATRLWAAKSTARRVTPKTPPLPLARML